MTEFLRQVAEHYYAGEPANGRLCFVFPSKRAIAFFKKYLGEMAASRKEAILAPECYTMNEFFCKLSGSHKADRIQQTVTLYKCYCSLYPKAESLDDFLYWGGVILSDFDDVDKYLADPQKLWKNVEEFKQMQDLSFLSEDQQAAVKEFLGQFNVDGQIKRDFLQVWNILLPLYRSFGKSLADEGLSYEGGIYRKLADALDRESVSDILDWVFEKGTRYVFTGLNALNECEKKLLSRMKKAGLAEFCWDFSSPEIRDPKNKSSFFMARNIEMFGQSLPSAAGEETPGRPEINVLSVPSAIGQAKQLPSILERTGAPADIRTAIVLPDEGLLIPVLSSIPEDIREVNVTMGYPMKGSEWAGMFSLLGALQQGARETPAGTAFYHRQVWALFSNGVFQAALGESEKERADSIKKAAKFYIPEEDFGDGPLMQAVFRKCTDKAGYLRNIILLLADAFRGRSEKAMELEFAMHSWKVLQRFSDINPPVTDKTWWKLLLQLLSSEAVPFSGEPLKGLQIMGPLETRTLDFDNLIILSCNEGMFPRRAVASSFIPPELRKGFGLPTYEYQDAIWAYYFYRLLQRAKKVWLVMDSRTEVSRSGEESRYIKQLELLYGFEVHRYIASSPIKGMQIPDSIPKTQEHLDIMAGEDFHLSASSLRKYLNCQAAFYYSAIEGLGKADEIQESLDAGMLGNVLHSTMHALYSHNPDEIDEKKLKALPSVSLELINSILDSPEDIRRRVRDRILFQLGGAPEITGRNLVYEEIVCRYVRRILEIDRGLLKAKGLQSFKIIGLEQFRKVELGGFTFVGYIDRIDSFSPGTLRVVDYKTGKVTDEEMNISESNAGNVVKDMFGADNAKRPGIALQIYLYDRMMESEAAGRKLLNSIYPARRLFVEDVKETPRCKEFEEAIEAPLTATLEGIRDLSIPWHRTRNADDCQWCEFKKICGR